MLVLAYAAAASSPLFAKISTGTIGYASAAPSSIPADGSGIAMVRWTSYQNVNDTNYSSLSIQLTSNQDTATFDETKVSAELRYALNNSTTYSAAGTTSIGTYTFGQNERTHVFSFAVNGVAKDTYITFWVLFSFASIDSAWTAGCEVTQVIGDVTVVPTAGYGEYTALHGVMMPLDSYVVDVAGTGLAPGEKYEGTERVGVAKLVFTPSDTSTGTNALAIDRMKLTRTGLSGVDADFSQVALYLDDGTTPGALDAGDTQITGAAGILASGSVTLTPSSDLVIGASAVTALVGVNIAAVGAAGHNVGLEVTDPSTDVVFSDSFADAYVQIGTIASTSATPTTDNTVDILQFAGSDTVPPTVTARTPSSGAVGVLVDAAITVTFDDAMNVSSLTEAGAITVVNATDGGGDIGGVVTYASQTATYTAPGGKLLPGKQYTVTVSYLVEDDAGNPMGADISANVSWSFYTESSPAVLYTSPASGGANVLVDSTVSVTFTKDMSTAPADAPVFTFTQGTGGSIPSGTVSWDATNKIATFSGSSNFTAEKTYTVEVSGAKDPRGNPAAAYSWDFTTESNPFVTTMVPATGASNVYVTQNVSATFDRQMSATAPVFEFSGGAVPGGAATWNGPRTVATFTLTTPLLEAGVTYTVTVSGATDARGSSAAPTQWQFDTEDLPAVIGTSPAMDVSNVAVNTTLSVSFSKDMDTGILPTFAFSPAFAPGSSTVAWSSARVATYTITSSPNLATSTLYTVTVSGAKDVRANSAVSYDMKFTTEDAPAVTTSSPTPDLSNVPVNYNSKRLMVTFSKDMKQSDPKPTFTFVEGAPPAGGAVSWSSPKILLYSFTGVLAPEEDYRIEVSGAEDTHGNAAATYTLTFATEARPQVTTTDPYDGEGSVYVTPAAVTATFTKSMLSDSLTTDSFTLEDLTTSSPVTGCSVSYVDGTKTATLTPPGGVLAADTTYRATLTTDVTDSRGNGLASSVSWDFQTEVEPEVNVVSPADGLGNVYVTTTEVRATFSKAMDPASINDTSFTLYAGATDVSGVVSYDAGENMAIYTVPGGRLEPGVSYTATLDSNGASGIRDSRQVPLSGDRIWTFSTEARPVVTVKSPYDGAGSVTVDSNVTAKFSKEMRDPTDLSSSTFTVTPSGGSAIPGIVSYDAGTKTVTFDPSASLEYDALYEARVVSTVRDVRDTPIGASTPADDVVWTFTTAPRPAIVSTAPFSNASDVQYGSTVRITFSRAMDSASVYAAFTLINTDTSTPVTGTWSVSGNTYTFTPDKSVPPESSDPWYYQSEYTASVAYTAMDLSANRILADGQSYSWAFRTVQNLAPDVLSTTPADHAVDVLVTTTEITATLSEPLDPASIGSGSLTISPTVSGAVSYAGGILTFTVDPADRLAFQTTYTATVSSTVRDLDGQTMLAPKVWQFTTPDIVRPTVLSTTPASDATSVSVHTMELEATLSEELDPDTVTSGVFTLENADGTPVAGTASYASSILTFTLDEGTSLAYGTTYTAVITSAAKDLDGFGMSSAYSWSFTTQSLVRPAVVSTTPAAGARDVPITTTSINVTFSTALDTALVSDIDWSITDARGVEAAGTATYGASVLRIRLDKDLAYSTTYTVTVPRDNVKDAEGIGMAADYTWTFTTVLLSEALAVNNRIDPAAPADQRQVRIFIPEPPAGAQDRVTVQVFTARGQRVTTLVAGRPYEEIIGDLPILWDGTNARSQKLAPGLYFIQITATAFKKTLRVLISG